MHKMKYMSILTICALLAGCSQSHTQPEDSTPSHPASSPAAVTTALPANVQASISILLGDQPYQNAQEVQKAAQVLHSFEESIPGIEQTLQNVKTGEYSKEITHSFPKAGIAITYHNGRVIGASRINHRIWAGVITYRGETIRIISVRPAREKEVEIYEG